MMESKAAAKLWTKELPKARKKLRKVHKDGDYINDRYLGKSLSNDDDGYIETQLNVFHSNVSILQDMLFGQLPKIDVTRTFSDPDDDAARVAGEIGQRILNQDVQNEGETYATMLRSVIQDRLIPGLGTAKVGYEFESAMQVQPAVVDDMGIELAPEEEVEKITKEWVTQDYFHWKDILWSPCRTFAEMEWMAFRSYMTKKKLKKRFQDVDIDKIPLNSNGPVNNTTGKKEGEEDAQAEVWEIWNKEDRCVYWFVEGMDTCLECKEDFLELDEFWPSPPFLMANATTSEYIPRADYALAQDLYREADELATRITILTRGCKLVGVYDQSTPEIGRMMQEGVESQLIPAERWAALVEKGGLKGVMDWIPIEMIAKVIEILTAKLHDKIQQIYEATGMSDLVRGFSQKYEAAATSKEKAKFASVRIQSLQEDIAKFASDLQAKKFQIIQKHFQPYCIIQQSNIMHSMDGQDPQLIQRAIQLLKDREQVKWRITIRPESLALMDYQEMQRDRVEYLTGLSTFLQSSAGLVQLNKKAVPLLLELLKWGLAGFRGSNQIEGVMDRAIVTFTQMAEQPEQPQPNPDMIKAQAKLQEIQMKIQADQEKHRQEMQQDQQKFAMEMQQSRMEFAARMQEMQQEFALKMKELIMTMNVRRQEQADQATFNNLERQDQLEADRQRAKIENKNGGANA